jgi:cell division protease FtsH
MKNLYVTLFWLVSSNGFLFQHLNRYIREPTKLFDSSRKYPVSRNHHEKYIHRLNSKNITIQTNEILNIDKSYKRNAKPNKKENKKENKKTEEDEEEDDNEDDDDDLLFTFEDDDDDESTNKTGYRIIINKNLFQQFTSDMEDDDESENYDMYGNPFFSRGKRPTQSKTSENFEVIAKSPINFTHVGGYQNIKSELYQCIDILANYTKYKPYNVRTPKGLIFEGPPGNGKTMLAKALAGEANIGFIAVSGSEFQDKYVGVGASRVRELFALAMKNIPCIIFVDEIDALGRKRSSTGDSSGNERDNTLNELLVALDGFKNTTGIFIIGATNRADLLDSALTRPGRIDKRIFINNPDAVTRKAVLDIHSNGKPYDSSISMENLVETTNGFSCAQIENLLNEAMLNALRYDRTQFTEKDVADVLNKIMVGWQPTEHQFTADIIDRIAVHELGHAVVGLCSKHHSKMTKIIINLSAPTSPAYTVFENAGNAISTIEELREHLCILVAGRVAEEVVYNVSITTGAINDFEEALKLAERMVCYYGMGKQIIYPTMSEKYKEFVDIEVAKLISEAYLRATFIIRNSVDLIMEGAELLKETKLVKAETLIELMNTKYKSVSSLQI